MKKTALLFMTLYLTVLALFCAGCKKNYGWKAQSSPKQSTRAAASSNEPIRDDRPTSVGVGSFLHDLFGTSLPADTDRYLLPETDEEKRLQMSGFVHAGDVYGDTLYFARYQDANVYAFSLSTGEERIFAEDAVKNPAQICTDADGVYVADVGAQEIVYFTFDGARAGSVALPEEPKANLDGPEGYKWMLERYYASLCHYDGLLLLAARDAIWTIADGETEWQRAEYPFVREEMVQSAALLSRDRIAVYTARIARGMPVLQRVTQMDRSGGGQTLLYEGNVTAMCANNGRLYITGGINGKLRLYEISSGTALYLQTVSDREDAVVNFSVSNGTLLVDWLSKKVDLIPVLEEAGMVSLLAPKSMKTQVEEIVDGSSSSSVRYFCYDDAAFFDKISASLMSGKADFDVALVTGEEEEVSMLLRAIVENGQFADLGQNGELSAHLDEAYSGVKEFIAVNGKLAFLPLEISDYWFGFTELAQDCGIPLPRRDWTTDELDAYVGSLLASGDQYDLFTEPLWQRANAVMSAALSTAQANMDSSDPGGHKAEDALKELFAQLTAYRESEVFSGPHAMFGAAGTRFDFIVKGTENYILALPPSAGKHPVQVKTFLFVNPKTERMEQALSLLADLTNEENRYNIRIFPTPLFPDASKYYKYEVYNPETQEYFFNPIKLPAFSGDVLPFAAKLDAFFPTYYSASEPALLTPTDRAMEAVSDFCTGKMTGEDCAKILYQEFVYKLKG